MATNSRPRGNIRHSGIARLTMLLLVAALSLCSELAKSNLRQLADDIPKDTSQPPLYLPAADHVRLITLGYNSFASHIIWFNTQSYFGKQLRGEQDYRWLGDMCLLMAELDPSAHHAFEFCATMLAWTAHNPSLSNKVLTRAVKLHPGNWYYRYLRGFNYFYFLGEPIMAKADLAKASQLPGAPIELLSGIVSRLMVSEGDPIAAIAFLKRMVETTDNKTIRKVLGKRLQQAYLSRNLDYLTNAAGAFQGQFGRYPVNADELVASGITASIPPDPFGGHYLFDPVTERVSSSTGEQGLVFKPHSPDYDPLTGETGDAP